MLCGGAFGSGGFGSLPLGSGASLSLASAAQATLSAVDVVFAGDPRAAGAWIPGDALNPASWSVLPLGPGVARLVQFVERIGVSTFRLHLDYTLTAGVGYEVIASASMLDEFGLPISADAECRTATLTTFSPEHLAGLARISSGSVKNDLANPQFRFDAAGNPIGLGTLQRTESGDLAVESGVPYLRKRIVRRLSTAMGEFFHLPRYGAGIVQASQRLGRPTLLGRLQRVAKEQIRLEPEVQACSVSVSSPNDGTFVFDVRVRTVAGLTDEFSTTVTIGAGHA